jgi:hypothetical protein
MPGRDCKGPFTLITILAIFAVISVINAQMKEHVFRTFGTHLLVLIRQNGP